MGNELSVQTLTREFTFLLSRKLSAERKYSSAPTKRQVHIDVPIEDDHLKLSPEMVSSDFVGPAVEKLCAKILPEEKVRVAMLELPRGCLADREFYDGVAVRGAIIGKITEQKIIRFDITVA